MNVEPNDQFWMWLIIGVAGVTLTGIVLAVVLLKTFVFKAAERRARRVADGRFDLIEEDEVADLMSRMSPKKKEAFIASAIKESSISNLGQELRNPLGVIMESSESLMESVQDEKTQAELKKIWAAGDHLSRVVNNFILLYRLDSRQLAISRETVHLESILKVVIEGAAEICALGRNKIHYTIAEGAREFVSDPEKIKMVLTNLVQNACKFTEDGSIDIQANRQGRELHISVKDTGLGIDERNLALIFESFKTVEPERYGIRGSGLGLAIAKRIAKFMGGNISVESKLGQGSCFNLTIVVDD